MKKTSLYLVERIGGGVLAVAKRIPCGDVAVRMPDGPERDAVEAAIDFLDFETAAVAVNTTVGLRISKVK
mgnify:FL=1